MKKYTTVEFKELEGQTIKNIGLEMSTAGTYIETIENIEYFLRANLCMTDEVFYSLKQHPIQKVISTSIYIDTELGVSYNITTENVLFLLHNYNPVYAQSNFSRIDEFTIIKENQNDN